MRVTLIPIVIGAIWTISKSWEKLTVRLGNKRTSGDDPDYSIVGIDQSPGDLKKLVGDQIPAKKTIF